MNSIVENELPGMHDLRDTLMRMIRDGDLAYKLPGNNPTFGELCVEMGQIQDIYTRSFTTLTQDWGYRGSTPEGLDTIAGLDAWYKKLDAEMLDVLSALSEDDVQNKQIARAPEFTVSLFVNFQIYREALLVFYAKASVYLKALEKPYPDVWKMWVG